MTKPFSALVLGEDTRSFLSVIRSLGKQGYLVDVVCYDNQSPSLSSKYIRQAFGFNYQSHTQAQWLEELRTLVERNDYDIVIPCDERAIFPLNTHKNSFSDKCKLAIPNQEVIDHLFDKTKTKALALANDVPVAKGELLKIKRVGFDSVYEQFGKSFVVKPSLSFTEDNLAIRQKVAIINSKAEFDEYLKYSADDDDFLIEEYFSGTGEGLSLLAINGDIQDVFAHTRVNEPRVGGGSSYRKAIPIRQDMLAACQRLCLATNYTGVGMFEFKHNSQTGKWILIEVNARFWGSLPLAIHAGIDFPFNYAQHLLGQVSSKKLVNQTYNNQAFARSLSNDIFDTKAEFEYDLKQSPIKALRNLGKRFLGYRRLFFNETIDSYDAFDKAPFKRELADFYEMTIGDRIKRKQTPNQDRATQNLMRLLDCNASISIKFVCYGNIMRSPMAAHSLSLLCKEVKLNWRIESFGFHQNTQRQSPIECIEEASKLGIDLSTHRSQCLRQDNISTEDDIIFVFDNKNMSKLRSFYQTKHVYNLAHFIPRGLGIFTEIEDPYGKGNKATAYCYLLIVEAIKLIFEEYLKTRSL